MARHGSNKGGVWLMALLIRKTKRDVIKGTNRKILMCIHMIFYNFKVINNFPSTLHDFKIGKLALLIVEVPSNLPVPLVSIPPTIIPSWNCHIDNYVCGIFGL